MVFSNGVRQYLINLRKRVLINHQIRASEVRVIEETGKQLGVMSLQEALKLSRERDLDLVQITEKVTPPVCKIVDYGKYQYLLQKKEKSVKTKKTSEIKGIRLGFNISPHDMGIRAKSAEKFLKKGNRVMVEMKLRGRQKALQDFAKEKINQFIEILNNICPIKIDRAIKKESRGLTVIIAKETKI